MAEKALKASSLTDAAAAAGWIEHRWARSDVSWLCWLLRARPREASVGSQQLPLMVRASLEEPELPSAERALHPDRRPR